MKDRILELCKEIIKLDGFIYTDCSKIDCDECPFSSINNNGRECCSDRDVSLNIKIAKNYIKEHDKSIKESIEVDNYEYVAKSKEIGIYKNGYSEYTIYYNISNKPKFFMVFKTLELAKEIADKLDEVYYLGR